MSKISSVERALINNCESLTSAQISGRYKLANPRDAIYKLRKAGYAINLVNNNGKRVYSVRSSSPGISSYHVG